MEDGVHFLFFIFNYLNLNYVDDTKLREVVSTLEFRIRIQNDTNKLEKWSDINRMPFNAK